MKASAQTQAIPNPSFRASKNGILQRRCACGGKSSSNGECSDCRKKKQKGLQRRGTENTRTTAPPIVNEVIGSSGQALDTNIRATMEPQFGHDFSSVRVHTDAKASASAKSVNAEAYTVGNDIVFDEGKYAPGTETGRRLLAHELTHVVQQGNQRATVSSSIAIDEANSPMEKEAEQAVSSSAKGIGQSSAATCKKEDAVSKVSPREALERALPSDRRRRAHMMGSMFARNAVSADGQWLAENITGGSALEPDLRAEMEQKFGTDLSHVRLHTDTNADIVAKTLNARAATVGQHIVFGEGQFDPASDTGRHLLFHELAHAIQQKTVNGVPASNIPIAASRDTSEREASSLAQTLSRGRSVTASQSLTPISGPQLNLISICRGLCNAVCWASFSALCAAVAALCTIGSTITFGGLAIPCTAVVIATCGLAAFDASMCADVLCPEICGENKSASNQS